MEDGEVMPRLENMSEEFDEAVPTESELEAVAAETDAEPSDDDDDDSDVEGHLFQRR